MPDRAGSSVKPPFEYRAIAEQWAKAKRAKDAASATTSSENKVSQGSHGQGQTQALKKRQDGLSGKRRRKFERRWWWTVAFWALLLSAHVVGIWLFNSGFLLTRLVLPDRSRCDSPPIARELKPLKVKDGCWHPKTFDRAVVILIDALRYDFTVPEDPQRAHLFHNAFPFLYETAVKSPGNAFLRPFIADPPTATMQRLKGLTTGTLPTFVDVGSNFAGTAIDEDSILEQLRESGKKIAHLGDDTWLALFPGYFEPNISKAYDSFNVWDLHTVDNGVMDNLFPLLEPEHKDDWDFLIGHCLGVDHAGHRYGPEHQAMTAKLGQMDDFVRRVVDKIDDQTLLIVMGDHGMDSKGDHGGDSDDEVEAALWMYSKRSVFGRTNPMHQIPPATAKIRPVNQIDLVPTLSLLLGLPIPFNSLGRPIEEAFAGPQGDDWKNLAAVSRMAAAGVNRYQTTYFNARGIKVGSDTDIGSPADLWKRATEVASLGSDSYAAFTKFQEGTLALCRSLWARFDVPRMVAGVVATALGVFVVILYSSRDSGEDSTVTQDLELDYAETQLELMEANGTEIPKQQGLEQSSSADESDINKAVLHKVFSVRSLAILSVVVAAGIALNRPVEQLVFGIIAILLLNMAWVLHGAGKSAFNIRPRTIWGWMSVVFTVSQSLGFASNSYVIWEDSILLFFITTFGAVAFFSSFRLRSSAEQTLGIYHSFVFTVLGRLASYSKLCREEQMPYCVSTYYASVTSSTSAPWQLAIPFISSLTLTPVVKGFLQSTRSYNGLAPTWIGYAFTFGTFSSSIYWLIDAAGNEGWLAGNVSEPTIKATGVYLAQLVLALALAAGTTAFVWAPPNISIISTSTAQSSRALVTILGYANAMGSRYLFLPLNFLLACLLLSKPMGFGALAVLMWQILSLAEILDLNGLKSETVGPVMLGLLGNFYFFKTGHQAVLSSIQWDSAFIPLFAVRYPWTPLVVTLNTFAGQIVTAISIPFVMLWKVGPKQRGTLEMVSRAMGVFTAYYSVETLATMAWAGHLRRHLMLYRIFNPRYLTAAVVLLVVDMMMLFIALPGLRTTVMSVSDVFGWISG